MTSDTAAAPPWATLLAQLNDEDREDEALDQLAAPAGGVPRGEPSEAAQVAAALARHLVAARRELKRQQFAAGLRGVEQQALYDVGLAITSTLNLEVLSESILSWALSLLDARRAALYLLEGGRYRLSRALGGEAQESFEARSSDDVTVAQLPGASHVFAAAIEIEGSPRGLLLVGDKENRTGVGPFEPTDRRTLQLFANQAAIALENARLHRQALENERLLREIELAAEIQRQILPTGVPSLPGFEVLGWNRPARHVGGDYFNFHRTNESRLVFALGDVTGKGMAAALMVSLLHSALKLLLDRYELGPSLVGKLNKHVYESSTSNKFITMLVAELDLESGSLRYVNAGHNPAVVVSPDGSVRQLPSGGLPLGLFGGASYQQGTVEMGPGDLLCVYSDGITEAADPEGTEYELARLTALLQGNTGQPLPTILHAIDDAVTGFSAGAPQGDDQTVILVRRLA